MTTESSEPGGDKRLQLPVWLMITVAITLIVGLVGGLLISKLLSKQQISFSVVSLVSFVFTIALGAAAVILATITIVLSRHAEDALIRRSDEGIKLQNEVFVRTSEVLSKIQASTGVTEKRIEDIISGRTVPIVQEAVAKSKLNELILDKEVVDKITKDLAESLKSEIAPLLYSAPSQVEERLVSIEAKQKKHEDVTARWNQFRLDLVSAVQNISGVEVVSETKGKVFASTSESFWDLLIKATGKRFGFFVYTREQIWEEEQNCFGREFYRAEIIKAISFQVLRYNIDKVFITFDDEDVWSECCMVELAKLMDSFNANSKGPKLVRLNGTPSEIAEKIGSIIGVKKGGTAPKKLKQVEDGGEGKTHA